MDHTFTHDNDAVARRKLWNWTLTVHPPSDTLVRQRARVQHNSCMNQLAREDGQKRNFQPLMATSPHSCSHCQNDKLQWQQPSLDMVLSTKSWLVVYAYVALYAKLAWRERKRQHMCYWTSAKYNAKYTLSRVINIAISLHHHVQQWSWCASVKLWRGTYLGVLVVWHHRCWGRTR